MKIVDRKLSPTSVLRPTFGSGMLSRIAAAILREVQ
jgi:hypothetical protein